MSDENEPFKIGEIAIAQKFVNFPEYNNLECEIIGELEPRLLIHSDMTGEENVWMYRVQMQDGMRLGARPWQLRRRPAPKIDDEILREIEA